MHTKENCLFFSASRCTVCGRRRPGGAVQWLRSRVVDRESNDLHQGQCAVGQLQEHRDLPRPLAVAAQQRYAAMPLCLCVCEL